MNCRVSSYLPMQDLIGIIVVFYTATTQKQSVVHENFPLIPAVTASTYLK